MTTVFMPLDHTLPSTTIPSYICSHIVQPGGGGGCRLTYVFMPLDHHTPLLISALTLSSHLFFFSMPFLSSYSLALLSSSHIPQSLFLDFLCDFPPTWSFNSFVSYRVKLPMSHIVNSLEGKTPNINNTSLMSRESG